MDGLDVREQPCYSRCAVCYDFRRLCSGKQREAPPLQPVVDDGKQREAVASWPDQR